MPASTAAAVRQRLAQRKPDPVYLITGDDEAEMSRLASDIADLVESELRAFNVERMYAGEKAVTPATIVESAQVLPMMSDRRVVIVLRAERLLKPKRRGKSDDESPSADETPADTDVLDAYIKITGSRNHARSGRYRRRSDASSVQDAAETGNRRRMLGVEGRPRWPCGFEAGGPPGRATGPTGGDRRGTADRRSSGASGRRARRNGYRASSRGCRTSLVVLERPAADHPRGCGADRQRGNGAG